MTPMTRSLEETSEQLDKRLLAYALAAAGAVVLTPSASAEIVYTPTNVRLTYGTLPIDLNNDASMTSRSTTPRQALLLSTRSN